MVRVVNNNGGTIPLVLGDLVNLNSDCFNLNTASSIKSPHCHLSLAVRNRVQRCGCCLDYPQIRRVHYPCQYRWKGAKWHFTDYAFDFHVGTSFVTLDQKSREMALHRLCRRAHVRRIRYLVLANQNCLDVIFSPVCALPILTHQPCGCMTLNYGTA